MHYLFITVATAGCVKCAMPRYCNVFIILTVSYWSFSLSFCSIELLPTKFRNVRGIVFLIHVRSYSCISRCLCFPMSLYCKLAAVILVLTGLVVNIDCIQPVLDTKYTTGFRPKWTCVLADMKFFGRNRLFWPI